MSETSRPQSRRNIAATAVFALLLGAGILEGQTAPATMAGVVTDVSGKPIDSVVVMYTLGPNLPSNGLSTYGGMLAGTDGTFSFSNLAPGLYYLCAYAPPQKSVLDSCEWTFSSPTATVAAGQNLTGVQIVMQPGVRLQIRMNDLSQLLANPVLGRKGSHIQAALNDSGGFFHNIPLLSFDATGFNYEMVVPPAMPLTMQFGGAGLSLTDSAGAAIPFVGSGRPVVQIPAGSAPTLLTYSVGAVGATPTPGPTPTPTPPPTANP